MAIISLRNMKINQKGVIKSVNVHGELGRRLRDMGLVPNTEITIIGRAPLRDPVALRLNDFTLTLRNNEADWIDVELEHKPKDNMIVALSGNPNCGKTTLFNLLTGSRQHVGNYPGVTVEKREGQAKQDDIILNIVDLPGIYSLTAYSEEELVARNYLINEKPDIVINILDATCLQRNLYLSVQLMELGIPIILVLNMMDEVRKQKKIINSGKLQELFGFPVIETVARSGKGKLELIRTAHNFAKEKANLNWNPINISYGPDLDPVLIEMTDLIEQEDFFANKFPARWIALKYLEDDQQIKLLLKQNTPMLEEKLFEIYKKIKKHCELTLNTDPEMIITDYRHGYIASIIKQGVIIKNQQEDRIYFSDKVDRVLTHKVLGPVIMFGILYLMFFITFSLGDIPMKWLESMFNWIGSQGELLIPEGYIRSLIVSGIIDGVGGVLGFVPLILIMFLMIAFLEDSGYMARMAYMMDRVLRIFGLHGCSVMPFIISGGIPGGCAVPGIMATRTLRSPKEKLATLFSAPFMVCGAKVPVFMLIIATFFKESAAEAIFWITVGSWVVALLVAKFLRLTIIKGTSTPFVMELPPYRMPTIKGILIHTWERIWQYIKKAGTVILTISVIMWLTMTFPSLPDNKISEFESQKKLAKTQDEILKINNTQAQEALKYSLAGKIGILLEPITSFAGFDWRTNIAIIGGFAAKEVIVSTLGTVYSMGKATDDQSQGLSDMLKHDPKWNKLVAVSIIIFVMLYSPCSVTVAAMAKEHSWRWAVFSIFFNTLLAFICSVSVYQIGNFI